VSIVEANLTEDLNEFAETMEVVTLLKDQDLLNNRILRTISTFSKQAYKMTPAELSFLVQVYTSDEMASAVSIESGLYEIEGALISNSDRFSVEEFARIANSIRYQLSRDEQACFSKFLVHAAP
jgi:hypothetical protein